MTEQHMPARIWASVSTTEGEPVCGSCHVSFSKPSENYCHPYIRSDLAERMAEALEDAADQIVYLHEKFQRTATGEATISGIRSALSAFKDSAQDRGAS